MGLVNENIGLIKILIQNLERQPKLQLELHLFLYNHIVEYIYLLT